MVTESPEKQNQILLITLIFFIVACVAVAFRCYVRAKLLRAFGLDDALAVCSLLLLCLGMVFVVLGLGSGFGQHANSMTLERFVAGLKYWNFLEVVYPPTTAVIKLSIAVFLIRIAVNPIHLYTIYVSMLLFLMSTTGLFVILTLQCRPLSFFWRQFQGATDGHCIQPSKIVAVAYSHAAFSVLTDLTLGIVPIFIVADLQITTRTKVAIAITLALGSFASICTLTRLMFIKDLLTASDYLYSISNVIILSMVEVAVGLTASCLATLKPLIRSFLDWSERSMASIGALHPPMTDVNGRRQTRFDDTELTLRPDLKIIGFTTTIISSDGRKYPHLHASPNKTVGVSGKSWYSAHGFPNSHRRLESGKGISEAGEPAYHIK